jgi:hypothetical protein
VYPSDDPYSGFKHSEEYSLISYEYSLTYKGLENVPLILSMIKSFIDFCKEYAMVNPGKVYEKFCSEEEMLSNWLIKEMTSSGLAQFFKYNLRKLWNEEDQSKLIKTYFEILEKNEGKLKEFLASINSDALHCLRFTGDQTLEMTHTGAYEKFKYRQVSNDLLKLEDKGGFKF